MQFRRRKEATTLLKTIAAFLAAFHLASASASPALVPLRERAEADGYRVEWVQDGKTPGGGVAYISGLPGGTKVAVWDGGRLLVALRPVEGARGCYCPAAEFLMPVAAEIREGRMYVWQGAFPALKVLRSGCSLFR
jgi:hypothetical protein